MISYRGGTSSKETEEVGRIHTRTHLIPREGEGGGGRGREQEEKRSGEKEGGRRDGCGRESMLPNVALAGHRTPQEGFYSRRLLYNCAPSPHKPPTTNNNSHAGVLTPHVSEYCYLEMSSINKVTRVGPNPV